LVLPRLSVHADAYPAEAPSDRRFQTRVEANSGKVRSADSTSLEILEFSGWVISAAVGCWLGPFHFTVAFGVTLRRRRRGTLVAAVLARVYTPTIGALELTGALVIVQSSLGLVSFRAGPPAAVVQLRGIGFPLVLAGGRLRLGQRAPQLQILLPLEHFCRTFGKELFATNLRQSQDVVTVARVEVLAIERIERRILLG